MAPMPASPLVARVLRNFLFGCAALFVLTTLVSLVVEYNARVRHLQESIDEVLEVAQPPVTRALWNYDLAQLQTEMQALVLNEFLYKAEVYDERGNRLVGADKRGAATQDSVAIDRTVTRALAAPPTQAQTQQNIGSLRVQISHVPLRDQFWRAARYSIASQFVLIAVLAALLLTLLHRNVIVPLLALAAAVNGLDVRQSRQKLALEREPHHADEIDQLVDAINHFQNEIFIERDARRKSEQSSRDLGNELARMGRVATVQSLTTSIAHELNQPLGAILSNAETLELTVMPTLPPQAPLRDVLTDIVDEARRASAIVRDMRHLTEKRDIETAVLAFNPLVRQVLELIQRDTLSDRLHIEAQLADTLPSVRGNAVQLQQVILNLMANARDAIRHAAIDNGEIVIATTQTDPRWLQFSVRDNGPGIPPEKIDDILKPFFTTKQGGTGMGLWIAQMIVEQHGGRLSAGNAPTGGALFIVTLPVSS